MLACPSVVLVHFRRIDARGLLKRPTRERPAFKPAIDKAIVRGQAHEFKIVCEHACLRRARHADVHGGFRRQRERLRPVMGRKRAVATRHRAQFRQRFAAGRDGRLQGAV